MTLDTWYLKWRWFIDRDNKIYTYIKRKISLSLTFQIHCSSSQAQVFYHFFFVVVLLKREQRLLEKRQTQQISMPIQIRWRIFLTPHAVTSRYCFAHFQKWKSSSLFHPELAKMTRNTVTYWTTPGLANRKTCSFMRLNDAFWKTLLLAAKKKSRKLTDHGKQLLPRALISNGIVFYDTERIMGNEGRGERLRDGKDVNSIINTHFFVYCSLN